MLYYAVYMMLEFSDITCPLLNVLFTFQHLMSMSQKGGIRLVVSLTLTPCGDHQTDFVRLKKCLELSLQFDILLIM